MFSCSVSFVTLNWSTGRETGTWKVLFLLAERGVGDISHEACMTSWSPSIYLTAVRKGRLALSGLDGINVGLGKYRRKQLLRTNRKWSPKGNLDILEGAITWDIIRFSQDFEGSKSTRSPCTKGYGNIHFSLLYQKSKSTPWTEIHYYSSNDDPWMPPKWIVQLLGNAIVCLPSFRSHNKPHHNKEIPPQGQ